MSINHQQMFSHERANQQRPGPPRPPNTYQYAGFPQGQIQPGWAYSASQFNLDVAGIESNRQSYGLPSPGSMNLIDTLSPNSGRHDETTPLMRHAYSGTAWEKPNGQKVNRPRQYFGTGSVPGSEVNTNYTQPRDSGYGTHVRSTHGSEPLSQHGGDIQSFPPMPTNNPSHSNGYPATDLITPGHLGPNTTLSVLPEGQNWPAAPTASQELRCEVEGCKDAMAQKVFSPSDFR